MYTLAYSVPVPVPWTSERNNRQATRRLLGNQPLCTLGPVSLRALFPRRRRPRIRHCPLCHAGHSAIVGGGFFEHCSDLPNGLAWQAFGELWRLSRDTPSRLAPVKRPELDRLGPEFVGHRPQNVVRSDLEDLQSRRSFHLTAHAPAGIEHGP